MIGRLCKSEKNGDIGLCLKPLPSLVELIHIFLASLSNEHSNCPLSNLSTGTRMRVENNLVHKLTCFFSSLNHFHKDACSCF